MLDIVKAVCSIVENLGDDEGTFPSRSKLVWLLLIHSENQISFLEGSTLHVSGMESTQVLLIDSRLNHGHLSFFLWKVDCVLPGLFCFIFSVELNSWCIVKQVTRKNCFSPIDQKEGSSPSRPIRSSPQSLKN